MREVDGRITGKKGRTTEEEKARMEDKHGILILTVDLFLIEWLGIAYLRWVRFQDFFYFLIDWSV